MKSAKSVNPRTAGIGAMRYTTVAMALFIVCSLPCGAASFYVNSTSDAHDANPGNGTCLTSTGVCSLRAAVEEANALAGTDTIYPGSRTISLGNALVLSTDMTIDGNGSGSTEIQGSGLDRVFEITGTATVTIKEVRLFGGWAIGADGGLIHVGSSAHLTLRGCLLDTGLADNGGCIATEGELILYSTTVIGCGAGENGGGIAVMSGSTTVGVDSIVTGNDATNGGGVSLLYGLLAVDEATVSDNSADPASGKGGGLYMSGGATDFNPHRVSSSEISGNSAAFGGGIYQTGTPWLVLESSSVSGNSATSSGGGYYFHSGGFKNSAVVNTTFTGNTADHHGGAVYSDSDGIRDVELYNCTITDNTANADASGGGDGGGISRDGGAEIHLRNTLVADNDDGSTSDDTFENRDCWGELTSAGYNLIGIISPLCSVGGLTTGNLTGTLTTPLDAMLGAATSCWNGTAHPLLSGSPARDSGNPAGCYGPDGLLYSDQCGENRPFGPRCDIGSVEAQDSSGNDIFSDGFESGNTSAWS